MKLFQGKAHSLPASPSGAGRQGSLSNEPGSPAHQDQQSTSLRGLFSFTRPKTPSRAAVEGSSPSQDTTGSRSPSRLRQLFSSSNPGGRDASAAAAASTSNQHDQLSETNQHLRQQLEAERRSGEEWKAKWNHQNFKLQILTDILVMHLHEHAMPAQPSQDAPTKTTATAAKGQPSLSKVPGLQTQQSNKTASTPGLQAAARQPAVFKRPTPSSADMYSDFD